MEQQTISDNKNFRIQIIRPAGVYYQNLADEIIFPAQDGLRAILYNHAPFLTTVGIGIIRIHTAQDQWVYFYVQNGMLRVQDNFVSLITGLIIQPQDIVYNKLIKDITSKQAIPISIHYNAEQKAEELQHLRYQIQLLELSKIAPTTVI